MWIFTTKGFVSIVQHEDHTDSFHIRARHRGVLEDLFKVNHQQVLEDAGTDYKYRVSLFKGYVMECLTDYLDSIAYPNFKNAIEHLPTKEFASRTWRIGHELQDKSPAKKGFSFR